jgi:hypothetical protein
MLAWSEKTPAHLHFLKPIQKAIPSARFVHVVRSPVDAVRSMYLVTKGNPVQWGGARSLEACVARWNRDVRISVAAIRQSTTVHQLVVYEELVRDPPAVSSSVFTALGLGLSSAELRKLMIKRGEASASIVEPFESWKGRTALAIEATLSGTNSNAVTGPEEDFVRRRTAEVARELQSCT